MPWQIRCGNQDNYDENLRENDQWKRFEYGAAPSSSADWGWLQHIAASLNGNGRAAVVLDTERSLSRLRQQILEQGKVDSSRLHRS